MRTSLLALALMFGSVAHAQSDGRIAPRLTGDWQAPGIEDFAVFVRATQPAAKGEEQTPEKRKRSIASAKELLSSGKVNGATRAGLMNKLAELTAAQVDDVYQEEVNDYATAYASFIDGDGQGQPPKPDHDKSKSLALQAIETHRNLIEQFPKFRKRSDILLRLAVLLGRAGSPNALPAFEGVMDSFAGKRAGQLAAVGAGDVLLQNGKLAEATASYKKALKGKDGLAKRYARYRLAWVPAGGKTLAAADAKKALGTLKGLAAKGCKDDKKGAQAILCREVGYDLVFLFAETERESEAKAFFKKNGDSEYYFLTLERSGRSLLRAGKPLEAAERFESLLKEAPTRATNPRIHAALAATWDKAGRPASVCEALTGMKKSYVDAGAWRNANQDDKSKIADAESLTKSTTLAFGRSYAERFKAKNDRGQLVASNCAYGIYVEAFPKSEEIQTVRFAYAQGLEAEGKNQDAARQFMLVAEGHKDGNAMTTTAAQRMLVLQEKVVLAARANMPPIDVGKAKGDEPLTETETLWVGIVDLYAKIFPSGERVPALKLDVARVLLSRGQYKQAVQRLDALAKTFPSTKEAQTGVKLVIALFNAQRNYVEVVHWAKEFHGRGDLTADQTLKGFLREAWRQGMWDRAEQLQAAKEIEPAAKAFLAYQDEFPTAKDADQALARASGLFLGLGKGKDGIRACETLSATYAQSALRPGCRLAVADVYEQLLEYEPAAISEAAFANENPKDERALKATLKAADLYVNAQNSDMAVVMLNQVLTRWAGRPEAAAAQLRLAEIREGVGEVDQALVGYQKFVTAFGATHVEDKLYAEAKIAALLNEHRDEREGMAKLAQVEAGLKAIGPDKGAKARRIAGRERLDMALTMTPEPRDWHVSYADFEAFKRTYDALEKKLDTVSKEYLKVIADGDPESGIAAYYHLGNAYEAASRAFKAPPQDHELTHQAVTEANAKREKFLADAQKAMVAHWEAGYALAKAKDRHEAWRGLTRAKLAKIAPGKYKEAPEQILRPSFTSHRLSQTDAD